MQPTAFFLLAILAATIPQVQAQSFEPVAQYPTVSGTRPYGLALADLNGDGVLDILAGDNNGTSHTTSLLPGLAGGQFGSPTAVSAVYGSFDLAVGDVNLDGRPDIVSSYAGAVSVGVQLGQAGGFGAATTFNTGGVITQTIALGDLNGDGRPDIVTANLGTSNVSVLLGRATGFAPAVNYSTGANSQPFSVALGDLNGDGRLDIVTGNIMTSTVGVLLGQATGGFAPAVSYPAFIPGSYPNFYLMGVALADVDGDGRLDVVATTDDTLNGFTLGVLPGQANGLGPITYYSAPWGHSVAVGDLNGDNWPDIAVAGAGANAAGVLLGYPGGFSVPTSYFTGAGSVPWTVALGDVNNDGLPDLVTTNSATSSVGVLLRATPLPLTAPTPIPSSGNTGITIVLNGTNLQGAVAVVFEGTNNRSVSSGFTVNAAGTQITGIVVPSGARSGLVRVVTPNGTATSTTAFTVQTATSTFGGSAAQVLTVHPNPARASATLSLPTGNSARPVVILDAVGRTVRQQVLPAGATTIALNLEHLQAGLYAVRCDGATTRLVVE